MSLLVLGIVVFAGIGFSKEGIARPFLLNAETLSGRAVEVEDM